MTESFAGVRVAIARHVVGVVLCAVVVCELEDALTVRPMCSMGYGRRRIVGQEVEIEFGVWLGDLLD